jgi:hypothetical protein
MNFNEALEAAENNKKIKRSGWKYCHNSFITLLECNNEKHLYISNAYYNSAGEVEFNLQYDDLKAEDWKIVD